VGEARHLNEEQLNALADRFMDLQPAEDQLTAGLVDMIVYTQDIDSLLRIYAGTKDYHLLSTTKMANVKRPESKAKDKVAVLYLEGEITDDSGDGIVGKEVVKTIKKIRKEDDVKALVLRVNSPGGSADASEQIWHAIQNIKSDSIPVVVSMGDYAASGGYYISCGADYIYAEPTTITGSIGIFGTIPDVSKLRDKVGIDIDGVATNKHSDMDLMVFKGMTSEEEAIMQSMIERGYDLFTRRCAEGRHVEQDYIKSIAEGRVWLGSKGKEIGIVDEMGNLEDAVSKAVELAGLENYKLVYYPEIKDP
jgi:protease-4